MAAIHGLGQRSISRSPACSSTSQRRTSSSVQPCRSLRFAPAQKARFPAPVITTARMPGSTAAWRACCPSSATIGRERTFICASLSMVRMRTSPRVSALISGICAS